MRFDSFYLLYGAVFLGTILLIEGAFSLIADLRHGTRRAVNRRLRMLESGQSSQSVLYHLRRDKRVGLFSGTALDRLIAHAGLTISTMRFLTIMAAATLLVLALMIALTTLPRSIDVAVAVLVGIVGPILYLRMLRKRRLKRFASQLPDALDVIVRSLKAGHPVPSALGMVAKEMTDPIGSEFGITVDEMTYGLSLPEALGHMADRVDQSDLKFVLVAINIQHGTGGNLAEVLAGISSVIRARFRMKQKVMALSAEGRLSAVILSVLPFLVAGLIFALKAEYFAQFSNDPRIYMMIGSGFLMMILGVIIMHRLVRFRI